MPKILHVIGSLVGGGAETQLKILLRGLIDQGWCVGVLYFYDDVSFNQREGINCYKINRGSKYDLLTVYHSVQEVIEDFSPDVVQTWIPEIITLPALIEARRRGIPVVNTQRRSLRHRLSLKGRLRDLCIPICHLLGAKVVTNFPFEREPAYIRRLIRMRAGEVVRNAVCLGEVRDGSSEWLSDGTFKIVYVGRLVEQKRVDLLLRAISKLRLKGMDVQLTIYGEGSCLDALQCLACSLELEEPCIRFEGYCVNWHSYARQYDLLVLPSVAEGMPNVLVEAMALGLPILSTNIFEISQLVSHGDDGWLVKANDEAELTKGLLRLIQEPELLNKLHAGGLRLSANCSASAMTTAYVNVYEKLMSGVA